MSISDKPEVKITPNTAKDISTDIWAGAIEYASETGYKLNPIVTTAIWNGLLLTVKKDLEEYDLLDAVQQQFIHSFSFIYAFGMDNVELLADLKNKQQKIWEILSSTLENLHDNLEILIFIKLLDEINAQFLKKGDSMQSLTPAEECVKLFQSQRQLLSTHIYRMVHGLDNGMIRQFAPVYVKQSSPAQKTTTENVRAEHNETATKTDTSTKKHNILPIMGFIALILLFLIVLIMLSQADRAWLTEFFAVFSDTIIYAGIVFLLASVPFCIRKKDLGKILCFVGLGLTLFGLLSFYILSKLHFF